MSSPIEPGVKESLQARVNIEITENTKEITLYFKKEAGALEKMDKLQLASYQDDAIVFYFEIVERGNGKIVIRRKEGINTSSTEFKEKFGNLQYKIYYWTEWLKDFTCV